MRLPLDIYRARPLRLTPLIDVIFLLLLFFMLSSTFTHYGEVELSLGQPAEATTAVQPDIVISIDGAGMRINGEPVVGVGPAASRLIRLKALGAETALVRVMDGATSESLIMFLDAARRHTDLSVVVAR